MIKKNHVTVSHRKLYHCNVNLNTFSVISDTICPSIYFAVIMSINNFILKWIKKMSWHCKLCKSQKYCSHESIIDSMLQLNTVSTVTENILLFIK